MNRFIKSILQAKPLFVFLALLILTFLSDFAYFQYVQTEQVTRKYQEEIQAKQEAEVYNEYDEYLSDFKEDLADLEMEEEQTTSYDWGSFYVDIIFTSLPFTLICLGLSALLFLGFHFTKSLPELTFGCLINSTLLAYLIFPLSTLFECFWFGLIQTDYQAEDLHNLYQYLNPSIQSFLESPKEFQWYNELLANIDLQSILFVLLIPLFLTVVSQRKYNDLLKRMILPIIVFFMMSQVLALYYFEIFF